MNRFWLAAIALFALTARAQNINFADVQHIHTALNHLTVIDLGEPIQFIAAADPDSFQIEHASDKVLLQPLKVGASTNLVLWTASRQISYELDAPGEVEKMNVLVRNIPPVMRAASELPTERERQQIAAAATMQAMRDAQDIVADQSSNNLSNTIAASIVRVLHTSEGTYAQYRIVNHSPMPFHVTTPTVSQLSPTQTPVSLLALRNHQLSPQMLSSFKAKVNGASVTPSGQSQQSDVAPGTSTSGYVLIPALNGTAPEIFQLNFGSTVSGPIVECVVI